MKIKQLYINFDNKYKCSSILSDETIQYWQKVPEEYRPDTYYCKNNAKYEIDGKLFCRKHAGFYVLDKVLMEQEEQDEN